MLRINLYQLPKMRRKQVKSRVNVQLLKTCIHLRLILAHPLTWYETRKVFIQAVSQSIHRLTSVRWFYLLISTIRFTDKVCSISTHFQILQSLRACHFCQMVNQKYIIGDLC
jgi:protein gp37